MIKTGIIGTSLLSNEFFDNIKYVRELDLIGVHSKPDKGELSYCTYKDLKAYESKSDLIYDCDAVIAFTPMTDSDNISYLIKNSKHVYFEPPKNFDKDAADRLNAIIEEADVKVQVGYHYHVKNTFLSCKPFIEKPRFIFCESYRRYDSSASSKDLLFDMLSTDIDIALSVVKSEIKNVVANATAIEPGKPDVLNVRIEFFNGCVAQFVAGTMSLDNRHVMKFCCNKKYVNIDFEKNKAFLITKKDKTAGYKLFQENFEDLNIEPIYIKPNNTIYHEFSSFAKSIVYDRSPEYSLESTLKTLSVLHLVKEKIKLSTSL